ncbi:MAG: SEFIR domain-containing protein, partial [Alphaproteobacteria bacterium]
MPAEAPVVFISYSHDSPAHRDKVLAFADRLRTEGVKAEIDRYEQFPPEGWNAHCAREIRRADRVLIVCTEIYRRRWDGEEEPGRGYGVRSEANLIRNYFYEDGSETRKFVPIMFDGATEAHIPGELKGLGRYRVETEEGYEQLYRLLTGQHDTPAPRLGDIRVLPVRDRKAFGTAAPPDQAEPPPVSEPHPRAADLFVGRKEDLERLEALLFPSAGTPRPVVVSGMAGVGKSYLVDRFYWDHQQKFPGGYLRLSLDPEKLVAATELIAQLTDRFKLPVGDVDALRTRLLAVPSLVHIENADTPEAGRIVAALADSLPGCVVVISARFRPLGSGAGWGQVPLELFDTGSAIQQLAKELGSDASGQEDWPDLVAALGFLPLALHLAAGHLREGTSAAAFLRRLRA